MASLSYRKAKGTYAVQFGRYDCRKTVHLGDVPKSTANRARSMIEALHVAKLNGAAPDPATVAWLREIGPELSDRIAATGLIAGRSNATVAELTARYLEHRQDVGISTRRHLAKVAELMAGHFPGPCRSITTAQVDEFAAAVRAAYASATYSKYLKRARQFFAAGIRWGMLDTNPLAGIRAPKQSNPARAAFIPADVVRRMMAEASPTFRLVLAFARFGGLRIPSELVGLRWEDFRDDRFLVRSPKTGERWCPLFPELAEHLERRRAGPVFASVATSTSYRACMERLWKRCKVKPWDRAFHNLRASRQTELTECFPTHVVCKWIGNSPRVAEEHYLQITGDHFNDAALRVTALREALQHQTEPEGTEENGAQDVLRFPVGEVKKRTVEMTLTGFAGAKPTPAELQRIVEGLQKCAANCAASRLAITVLRRAG